MLFSRSKEKDKNTQVAFDAPNAVEPHSVEPHSVEPHSIEEETIRRWRDMVQNRSQRSMFEEDELNFTPPNTGAPQWPTNTGSTNTGPTSMGANVHGATLMANTAIHGSSEAEIGQGLQANWELETRYNPTIEMQPAFELNHETDRNSRVEETLFQLSPPQTQERPTPMATPSWATSSTRNTPVNNALMGEVQTQENTFHETFENPPAPAKLIADLSLPIEQDLKRRFGTNIRSALGPGTVIEGTFKFDSPVCVDGSLTGEITSTSALIVGQEAVISGKIKVGSLIVLGTVEGKVEATDLVEIRRGGMLEGDITTERFVVEDGGWYNGKVKMER